MAVWSEVDLYDVAPASRFDSEYFDPYFLMIEEKLKKFNSKPLNKIADYINRGLQPQYDVEGTIKALRSVNIRNGMFSETRQEFVTEDFYNKNPRGQVKTNDLLISSTGVGTLGRVLLNNQLEPLFADGHITIIRDIQNRNLHFLSLFLQSKIGFALITRRQRGSSGQIEIYPDDIGSLPIPRFDDSIENEIGNNYIQALTKIKSSESLYQEAEVLLLHELGLDALDLSNHVAYESSFDVFAKNSRLDSEFYQPKYEILADALSSIGSETVGSWGKALKGKSVSEYIEDGIPVVRSGDLTDINNVEKFKYASSEEDLFYLKRGDVLISSIGFGSIGKVQVFEGEDNAFATVSEVTVIRQNRVNPYYLQLFLQSVGGQLQIEKWITGATGQLHLYPRDVEKFLIPIIDKEKQEKFEELIKNAVSTKEQAKQLLEDAKQRVEDMILGN